MTHKPFLCVGVVLVLLAAITVHRIVVADASTIASHTPALAEVQPEASIGRYQIAVFGEPADGSGPGYYIIDTATGELWMAYRDQKPGRSIGIVTSKASTAEKDQEASRPLPDKQNEESSRHEEIYINATRTQVRDLCYALYLYRMDVGDYPSTDEGLQSLVAPPATQVVEQPNGVKILKWLGPYLKNATVPLDPWGRKFRYTYQLEEESPTVTSAGPDGKFDTEDDIKECPPRK